jgi:hypothetical protein
LTARMWPSEGEAAPVPNSSRLKGRNAAACRVTLMDWARNHGPSTPGTPLARGARRGVPPDCGGGGASSGRVAAMIATGNHLSYERRSVDIAERFRTTARHVGDDPGVVSGGRRAWLVSDWKEPGKFGAPMCAQRLWETRVHQRLPAWRCWMLFDERWPEPPEQEALWRGFCAEFGPHLRVRRPILAWRPGLPDLPSARRGRRAESSIRRVLLLRLRSQPPPPRGPDVPTSHPDTTSAPGLTRLPRIRTLPRIHAVEVAR